MKISIISASTRKDNNTHRVGLLIYKSLLDYHLHPNLINLKEYNFPIFDEVFQKLESPSDGLKNFSNQINKSDAIIFVSPEYNGSYTSALKNAVDCLKNKEFYKKLIGVVSVSTGALGGIRAAIQMQQLVLSIQGYAMPQMLLVPNVTEKIDENGEILDKSFVNKVKVFIDEFLWLADAIVMKKNVDNLKQNL
jgi:NAD(P)H-dependent FMN reductase